MTKLYPCQHASLPPPSNSCSPLFTLSNLFLLSPLPLRVTSVGRKRKQAHVHCIRMVTVACTEKRGGWMFPIFPCRFRGKERAKTIDVPTCHVFKSTMGRQERDARGGKDRVAKLRKTIKTKRSSFKMWHSFEKMLQNLSPTQAKQHTDYIYIWYSTCLSKKKTL